MTILVDTVLSFAAPEIVALVLGEIREMGDWPRLLQVLKETGPDSSPAGHALPSGPAGLSRAVETPDHRAQRDVSGASLPLNSVLPGALPGPTNVILALFLILTVFPEEIVNEEGLLF